MDKEKKELKHLITKYVKKLIHEQQSTLKSKLNQKPSIADKGTPPRMGNKATGPVTNKRGDGGGIRKDPKKGIDQPVQGFNCCVEVFGVGTIAGAAMYGDMPCYDSSNNYLGDVTAEPVDGQCGQT